MVNRIISAAVEKVVPVTLGVLSLGGCDVAEDMDPNCAGVQEQVDIIEGAVVELLDGNGNGCNLQGDGATIECTFLRETARPEFAQAVYLFGKHESGYNGFSQNVTRWIKSRGTGSSTVDYDSGYSNDFGDAQGCTVEGFHPEAWYELIETVYRLDEPTAE